MAGVALGSVAKPWHIVDPSITLAALFGTTLAPIAGRLAPVDTFGSWRARSREPRHGVVYFSSVPPTR